MIIFALACARIVAVEARPEDAAVTRGAQVVALPGDVRCPAIGACRVAVTRDGYRPLDVVLKGRHVELLLVPDHGPAGTWTPEDQGLAR